jgi:putative addiction module component (TIGR02574 family)
MINKSLKEQALELSQKDRAQLAHFLIDSLNPDADFESQEAWSKELESRIYQYEQGETSTKSWNKVKENAQDLLNK